MNTKTGSVHMKNGNRPVYKINWWKGFEMHKESFFLEKCLGYGVLMVCFGVMSFLVLKGLAEIIH
jgi:hypothetical protein